MRRFRLEAFQQNERLTDADNIPVADNKLRNDAALKMLDGLSIAIGAYDAGRNCAAGERHEGSPTDKARCKDHHDKQPQAHRPAERPPERGDIDDAKTMGREDISEDIGRQDLLTAAFDACVDRVHHGLISLVTGSELLSVAGATAAMVATAPGFCIGTTLLDDLTRSF